MFWKPFCDKWFTILWIGTPTTTGRQKKKKKIVEIIVVVDDESEIFGWGTKRQWELWLYSYYYGEDYENTGLSLCRVS